MKYFLGIDIGTSGVKAIILSETGEIAGTGFNENPLYTPKPGWAEQDAEELWQSCSTAVQQAVKSSRVGNQIEGIGFSGQMQGCVFLDNQMQPLCNSIIWLDQRATAEVEEIDALLADDMAFTITANHCINSFWAPKIIWLRKNRPEIYKKVAMVLFVKDYIRYKMTGELAADVSDASLSFLMDVPNRKWSYPILDKLSIPHTFIPENLLESQDEAGRLRKAIADEWGVRPGILVVAGGGDQPVGGVGTGVVEDGVIGATIGTSGVIFACTDKPFIDLKKRAMMSMAHAVPDKWCFLGLVLTAGGSFKWLRDKMFRGEKPLSNADFNYDYMTAMASKAPIGSEGLLFLPYFNGEKTPVCDDDARAAFVGLSYRHGQNELCRSVMEGVTFALRDTIEICKEYGLNVAEIRSNGGGAKSELWRQIQADIFNVPIVTMNMEEGPAAGGAMLAAVGTGCFSNVTEVCKEWLKTADTKEPIQKNASIYNEYYQNYRALYPALKDIYQNQAKLVGNRE